MIKQDLEQLEDLLQKFRRDYTSNEWSKWKHYDSSVAVVERLASNVKEYGGNPLRKEPRPQAFKDRPLGGFTDFEQATGKRPVSEVQASRWEIP